MGAWFSSTEAEAGVAPTPSASRAAGPVAPPEHAETAVHLDGTRPAPDARALPGAWPWRGASLGVNARDMGCVGFPWVSPARRFGRRSIDPLEAHSLRPGPCQAVPWRWHVLAARPRWRALSAPLSAAHRRADDADRAHGWGRAS